MINNNKKGFTLIELLVVIAIIGILSAIGLVSLNGAREKARDSKARSDFATMRTGLALWFDDHNSTYPGEAVDGTADISRDSGSNAGTGIFLTSGTFITEYMADLQSPSLRTYRYITSRSAGGTYALDYALAYNLEGAGGTFWYSYTNNNAVVTDVADADTTIPSCTNDTPNQASPTVAGSCTH